MKVVVTGSEGYIGSVLCPLLRKVGMDVVALDIMTGWDASKDPMPLDGVHAVVPLAAVVGVPACKKDPARAREVIVGSAERLAEQLDGRGCVYLTTDSGYAPSNAAREDDPFYPRSVYARLKHEAAETLRAKGAAVFRLASLFGESPSMRDDLLAHFFVRSALTGTMPDVSAPDTRRAFVHVNDVCFAVVNTLASWPWTPRGRIFNLASNDRMTKRDLAEQVMLATNAKWPAGGSTLQWEEDNRDFWLESTWGQPVLRRLSAEIPKLVEYYRQKVKK